MKHRSFAFSLLPLGLFAFSCVSSDKPSPEPALSAGSNAAGSPASGGASVAGAPAGLSGQAGESSGSGGQDPGGNEASAGADGVAGSGQGGTSTSEAGKGGEGGQSGEGGKAGAGGDASCVDELYPCQGQCLPPQDSACLGKKISFGPPKSSQLLYPKLGEYLLREFRLADVTEDGIVDLVLLQYNYENPGKNGRIIILQGTSEGAIDGNAIWVQEIPPEALTLFVRDMNGDGKNDIAFNYMPDQQQVFLRKEGSFVAMPPFGAFGHRCHHMLDLDGDQFPDFLCIQLGSGIEYKPLFNNGDATFTAGVDVKTKEMSGPWSVNLRGPALDREMLLIGTGLNKSHLFRLINRETAPEVLELPAGGTRGLAVDVFGLGFSQIGFTETNSGAFSLFKIDPQTLAFSAAAPPMTSSAAAGYGTCVTAADMNEDGHVDLVFAKQGLSVFQQLVDGTFQETFTIPFNQQPPGVTGKVEAHDMNGDGLPELIFPDTLTVYPNTSK